MDLRTGQAGLLARALALVSLVMGLSDCMRLLGVGEGAASPLSTLGPEGFVALTVLALARLFAAVGLWMQVQWGAVLFGAALAVELVLFAFPGGLVVLGLFGFLFKLAALLATIVLIVLARLLTARQVLD